MAGLILSVVWILILSADSSSTNNELLKRADGRERRLADKLTEQTEVLKSAQRQITEVQRTLDLAVAQNEVLIQQITALGEEPIVINPISERPNTIITTNGSEPVTSPEPQPTPPNAPPSSPPPDRPPPPPPQAPPEEPPGLIDPIIDLVCDLTRPVGLCATGSTAKSDPSMNPGG